MVDELLTKAEDYFKSGEFELAVNIYKKILEQDKTNQRAHYCLGCICTYLKNIPAAVKEFEEVIKIDKDTNEAKIAEEWLTELRSILNKKKIIQEEEFVKPQLAPPNSKCRFHKDEDALYICNSCNNPICAKCTYPVKGKYLCFNCYKKIKVGITKVSPRTMILKEEPDIQEVKNKKTMWFLPIMIYLFLLILVILYRIIIS